MSNHKNLSVIVRFHDRKRLWQLDQSLFSLAHQTYTDIQIILVAQNANAKDMRNIVEVFVKNFPPDLSIDTPTVEVKSSRIADLKKIGPHFLASVVIPEEQDGRAAMLNEGLALAEGRFIAFLDYDDVVYSYAYAFLMHTALSMSEPAALIAGGCRKVYCRPDTWIGFPFLVVKKKEMFIPRGEHKSRVDLIKDNFLPIHSFIIDRSIVAPDHLFFVEGLSALEDYDFLLRLISMYEFNLDNIDKPVVEYRIRTDESNTVIGGVQTRSVDAKETLWARSQFFIKYRRARLGLGILHNPKKPASFVTGHLMRILDCALPSLGMFLTKLSILLRNYPTIRMLARSILIIARILVKFIVECIQLAVYCYGWAKRRIAD